MKKYISTSLFLIVCIVLMFAVQSGTAVASANYPYIDMPESMVVGGEYVITLHGEGIARIETSSGAFSTEDTRCQVAGGETVCSMDGTPLIATLRVKEQSGWIRLRIANEPEAWYVFTPPSVVYLPLVTQ